MLFLMFTVLSNNRRMYRSYIAQLQYWSWYSLNSDVDASTILTINFTKAYEDTALRLTASGVHRHRFNGGNNKCNRWYVGVCYL